MLIAFEIKYSIYIYQYRERDTRARAQIGELLLMQLRFFISTTPDSLTAL